MLKQSELSGTVERHRFYENRRRSCSEDKEIVSGLLALSMAIETNNRDILVEEQ